MAPSTVVVVTARDEAQRIAATLAAVGEAFPEAPLVLADDGSLDATAQIARARGAELLESPRAGKGQSATRGARRALELCDPDGVVVLCDGDLGASAVGLRPLADAVLAGADLVIGGFARRRGGGFGIALGFARWALRVRTGLRLAAPISGQRAIRASALAELLPFAPGFGIELAMTIDAARAGLQIVEVELDLEHRATGRNLAGFAHRGRQLRDFIGVYLERRGRRLR